MDIQTDDCFKSLVYKFCSYGINEENVIKKNMVDFICMNHVKWTICVHIWCHFSANKGYYCTIQSSCKILSKEEIQHISLALYQYMCRHIVGSEKTVKTKRLLTTVQDNLSYHTLVTTITSGSFGEGLEMKGSDLDVMFVMKGINVYEYKSDIAWDITQSYFEINTDDTKLGFVKLLLRHSMSRSFINSCVKAKDSLWLSNDLFKRYFANIAFRGLPHLAEVSHGPCLSDRNGQFDFAFCLHSTSWISQADQWVKRSRGSWPSNEVVSRIKEHGVLFVPIGVKGSSNEEIEWRISFSVGETLLIYSFNHTQLLCYALLKIVLKDIISADVRCKDLMCSYYLKNILFWVSEETPLSEWKPQNLIHCFMRCFNRLMHCVEYSLCPHYFIPENNMFENKIEGHNRRVLLDKLYKLQQFSWRCILFSPQLQDFISVSFISTDNSLSFADYFEQINSSAVLNFKLFPDNYDIAVHLTLSYKSMSIKLYHFFFLSSSCQGRAEIVQLKQTDANKDMYRKYKTCEPYLVQCLQCYAVSDWLKLASFYYQMKQYRKVLAILAYSVSKCSQEMIQGQEKLSTTQRHLLSSKTIQTKGLIRVLQLLRRNILCFYPNSILIPHELELEIVSRAHVIPPVVFAHFLSFLCHYHLNDTREYRNSLVDLQLTISEQYFIADSADSSVSYNVLGVAFQILGQNESAREAFQLATELDPMGRYSCAPQRLSMID